ncbi:MAG: hypothetical protein HY422_03460 [Candidatus Komeilibacteria bacterium]|nr:hypothetical protein [Candidatus Komeilibacteria bacterium]
MGTLFGIVLVFMGGLLLGSAKKEQLTGFLSDRVLVVAIAVGMGIIIILW